MKTKCLLTILLLITILFSGSNATNRRKTRKLPIIETIGLITGLGCFIIGELCGFQKDENLKQVVRMHDTYIKDIEDLKTLFSQSMLVSCSYVSIASTLNAKTLSQVDFTISALKLQEKVKPDSLEYNALMDKIAKIQEPYQNLAYLEEKTTKPQSFYKILLDSMKSSINLLNSEEINRKENLKALTASKLIETLEIAKTSLKKVLKQDEEVKNDICFNQALIQEINESQKMNFKEIDQISAELEGTSNILQLFTNPAEYRKIWLKQAEKNAPSNVKEIKKIIDKNQIWWRITKSVLQIGLIAVSDFRQSEFDRNGISRDEVGNLNRILKGIRIMADKGDFKPILEQLEKILKNLAFKYALKVISTAFSASLAKFVVPAKVFLRGVINLISSYKETKKIEQGLLNQRKNFKLKTENAILFANFKTTAVNRTSLINYSLVAESIQNSLTEIKIDANISQTQLEAVCKENIYVCTFYFSKEYMEKHFSKSKMCLKSLILVEQADDYSNLARDGFPLVKLDFSSKFKMFKNYFFSTTNTVILATYIHSKGLLIQKVENYLIEKFPLLESLQKYTKVSKIDFEEKSMFILEIKENKVNSEIKALFCENQGELFKDLSFYREKPAQKELSLRKTNNYFLSKICAICKEPSRFFTDDEKTKIKEMIAEATNNKDFSQNKVNFENISSTEVFKLRALANRKYKLNLLDAILIVYGKIVDSPSVETRNLESGEYLLSFNMIQREKHSEQGIVTFDSSGEKECSLPILSKLSNKSKSIVEKIVQLEQKIKKISFLSDSTKFRMEEKLSLTSRYSNFDWFKLNLTEKYFNLSQFFGEKCFEYYDWEETFGIKQKCREIENCSYFFYTAKVSLTNLSKPEGYTYSYFNYQDEPFSTVKVVEANSGEIGFKSEFYVLFYLNDNSEEAKDAFRSVEKKLRSFNYYSLNVVESKERNKATNIKKEGLLFNNLKSYLSAEIFVKPVVEQNSRQIDRICRKYQEDTE